MNAMEDTERYARQIALPEIGVAGQEALGRARAAVIGCGALGTNIAELLVRLVLSIPRYLSYY